MGGNACRRDECVDGNMLGTTWGIEGAGVEEDAEEEVVGVAGDDGGADVGKLLDLRRSRDCGEGLWEGFGGGEDV